MATPSELSIPFSPESLIRHLAICCVLLLAIHTFLTVLHYRFVDLPWLLRVLFDVDEEESIPTWFSSMLLLITSIVLFLVSILCEQKKDANAKYWRGLGLGFAFMSVDEIAGFHETLNTLIQISWAVPGLVIALVIGGIYVKFLMSLPAKVAIQFVVSGAIFVGGAVGAELATEPYLYNDALDTLNYNLWTRGRGNGNGGRDFFLIRSFWLYKTTIWFGVSL